MPNQHEFRLSCGCRLGDIAVAAGVVHCAHGRTIFAPGFVRERCPLKREMTEPDTDKSVDDELNQLCDGVALDVLREPDSADNIFQFALATARRSLRSEKSMTSKEIKEIEQALAPFVPQLEAEAKAEEERVAAEQARDVAFVEEFLVKLVQLPVSHRADSVKTRMLHILSKALGNLAIDGDDHGEAEPWDTFELKVCGIDFECPDVDYDSCRETLVKSFKAAAAHPDFDFCKLANAIREVQSGDQIRRLRLRAALREMGIIR